MKFYEDDARLMVPVANALDAYRVSGMLLDIGPGGDLAGESTVVEQDVRLRAGRIRPMTHITPGGPSGPRRTKTAGRPVDQLARHV